MIVQRGMAAGFTYQDALWGPLAAVMRVSDAMLWDKGAELRPAKYDTEYLMKYGRHSKI